MFCSNCGSSTLDAKFCPNCGTPIPEALGTPINQATSEGDVTFGQQRTKRKLWIPIVGGGAAVLTIAGLALSGVFSNPDIKECQELVLDRLKFRETAEFRETTVRYSTSGQDGSRSISVEGEVVASNGFGVPVTAEFWCTNFNTDELELEYLD